jgi:anti-anti-sigma factor
MLHRAAAPAQAVATGTGRESAFPRRAFDASLFKTARGGSMDWSEEVRGGAVIVNPRGRVDEATATAFGTQLEAGANLAADHDSKTLVINFAGLDYMSSRGLRALTLVKRKADGLGVTIILAAPNKILSEILAISRYDKLFSIAATVEGAL